MSNEARTSLVLTIIGPDRPGIVEVLSHAITLHGANWEESRMARLASRFAGILRVSVNDDRASALIGALEALSSSGLRVVCERSPEQRAETARTLVLEIVGNDRSGIVREISHALAERRVNIEEFQTECLSAPETGHALFKATANLSVPVEVSVAELKRTIERLAVDLVIDVNFEEGQATMKDRAGPAGPQSRATSKPG